MTNTMKIFAGITGLIAASAGVALYKKGMSVDFSDKGPFVTLNDEIGSEMLRDEPVYNRVIADSIHPLHTVIYKTVTPEFFEDELNKITNFMPITMCGDREFNGYINPMKDTGAYISYQYIDKTKLKDFINKINGDNSYNRYIITLGSRVLATHNGRYGDIITISTEESMGDEYNLHFVNIYGKWKFINYEQLEADTNAAMHFDDCGASSSHRLLRGVQVVALRDDTEEV